MLFEWVVAGVASSVIATMAKAEGQSPLVWGMIAPGLCAVCHELLLMPFVRIMIPTAGVLVLLLVTNMMSNKKDAV